MAFSKELSERARHEWASETHREGQQAPSPTGVAAVPTVDASAVLASHTLYVPLREGDVWDAPRCANCLDYWQGDDATGGCEAVLLARRVIALEAFVTRLLASHRGLEGLVCQEFGGHETDSDGFAAEWSALRAPRAGEGGEGD